MFRPFRFGVTAGYAQSHETWVALARRAETLGYATWLMPDRASLLTAPIAALAIAAEATTMLHVGSYVFCNEFRHPALLAREAATLHLLSGGRFELGLGTGASPVDFEQIGLPFASAGARVNRLEESIHVLKAVFTEETVSFFGKHYTITAMKGQPASVQPSSPPIFIASGGQRMLSIAAREADIIAPTAGWATERGDRVSLKEKVSWVREAAGERFDHLELAQTAYYLDITDSPAPLAPQGGGPPIQTLPMSTEKAVTHLLEQRDRYGFSYIQVHGGQMENFAPVVAQLAGK
jgi:probable F420-dependent oxidoreductase